MIYKSDCKYFQGDVPCKPHKEFGVHCQDCEYYQKLEGRILIIKLGAIGDVIRTTPLLRKIKKQHPNYEIWWLTLTPEILPDLVDVKLNFTLENIILLQNIEFDWLINLDKDMQACSLATMIKAYKKSGFWLENDKPAPINKLALPKFLTGLFDDISKANTKSYLEEIFEIAGWNFEKEEYVLDVKSNFQFNLENNNKKIVGLNTGCGSRWTSRLWPEKHWLELIKMLQDEGYYPLLLGGEAEHDRNKRLAEQTNATYLGAFPLAQFISLVDKTDIVVTAVTMALHIAIGLKKNIVLLNNIFNPNEFELYGRGVIVQPDKECKCFFKGQCTNDYFCMEYLPAMKVFEKIKEQLNK
ncbi:MAG: glycosyltransferase family 9 protein [Candidatus Kapaibacteriota bacterium]